MSDHTEKRRRLPTTRQCITQRRVACGFKYFITVSFYPDTSIPGEVFINVAKEGSIIGGLVDSLAVTLSVALQYGVPWAVMREKYKHTRFGDRTTTEIPSILHDIAISIDEIIEVHEKRIQGKSPNLSVS